jgi:hypothetical protein
VEELARTGRANILWAYARLVATSANAGVLGGKGVCGDDAKRRKSSHDPVSQAQACGGRGSVCRQEGAKSTSSAVSLGGEDGGRNGGREGKREVRGREREGSEKGEGGGETETAHWTKLVFLLFQEVWVRQASNTARTSTPTGAP